jgi:hypothetical protein
MKSVTPVSHPLPGLLILAVLWAIGAGCSDGGDSPCITTAKKICAAACTCGGSTRCAIGDSSGSISFDNEGGCVMLYSLGCSDAAAGNVDFAACQSALASPTCVQSSDGPALEPPAACDATGQ